MAAGRAFVEVLDSGRIGKLAGLCAPDATWWVDTGPDRAAGDWQRGVNDPRHGFPLNGRVRVDAKIAVLRELGAGLFPNGLRQQVERAFGDDRRAVVELEGQAVVGSGERYWNRYGFVFELDDEGRIEAIREYLDTAHSFALLGGEVLPPRTVAVDDPVPVDVEPSPVGPAAVASAVWPRLSAGDIDGLGELFAPVATWWVDSGFERDRGARDRLNGPPQGWPLHGTVLVADKLADMRARLSAGDRSPAVAVTPITVLTVGDLVAIEAVGHADLADGAVHQNRYLWVIEVAGNVIRELREYCDTLHVTDVMGMGLG